METRRGPRDPLVRRRPREQQIIELPPPRERAKPTDSTRHAKLFAIGLFAMSVLGTLLLALPFTTESGRRAPFVDALFTSISAVTGTGLTVFDTQEQWNLAGEIVLLILIQAGGLGFIVGASLVLQALRRGQTRLSDQVLIQASDPSVALRDTGNLVNRIVKFVFITEAIGAVLFTFEYVQTESFFRAAWYGVFHSISAFCNAGFDLEGSGITMTKHSGSYLFNGTMMLLIQAGALSYLVLSDVFQKRRWSRFALDTKLVMSGHLLLLGGGALLFAIAEWNQTLAGLPSEHRPMAALFQSVAARSAGFATVPLDNLHTVTLFTWVAIMLVGGASGSAGGGAKISTVAVIVAAVISTLRGHDEPTAFGRRIGVPLVFRALSVIVLLMIAHFITTIILVATEDLFSSREIPFIDVMFEAMSAVATVGTSTGITGDLADASKLVLCLAMFIGRLGPLTAVFALQRKQQPRRYRLPESPVRIG
jgi:trk system potassium uptake protein TrkH